MHTSIQPSVFINSCKGHMGSKSAKMLCPHLRKINNYLYTNSYIHTNSFSEDEANY